MVNSRTTTIAVVTLSLVALAGSLFAGTGFAASLVIWVAINVLLAASFRFVQLIGELNFAIAGFVGLGAYMSGICTAKLGLPFAVALVSAAFAATLLSLIVGYITLRTKGPYFMLISFAFTEVLRMIYTQIDYIGGNSGMIGIFPPVLLTNYYPAFVVAVVLLLLVVLYQLEQSDFGKVLVAIRNNDALVQTVGINVHLTKVLCLAISSFVAGIGGALLAHANNVISPGDFSFLLAVYTLAYIKVGGESHIAGPILGASVLTLLAQVAMGFGPYEHIFYGTAIVIAVLLMPDGLVGIIRKLLGLAPSARVTVRH
jgi:branched-chain amino acid transport system permease protein